MTIRLGYACINVDLQKKGIISSRTARLATVEKEGFPLIKEMIEKNLDDTLEILKWNNKHNIRLFRLSSNIFPHITNKKAIKCVDCNAHYISEKQASICKTSIYDITFAKKQLRAIGDYAKEHNIRLSFHAQPYVKLGSPHNEVVQNSINELEHYGDVFKLMGCCDNSLVVLHLGGHYDSLSDTLKRFQKNFRQLSKRVRNLICLENDELTATEYLLPTCKKLKIPLLFDMFHHKINPGNCNIYQLLSTICETWENASINGPIKMHISEQKKNASIGAHSNYVDIIPSWVFKLPYDLDLMVEAKMKEKAVMKLRKKYGNKVK